MLMPRKVKYRKQQRGRMGGKAKGGSDVTFGDFGIQALEPAWLTARQIEAAVAAGVAGVLSHAVAGRLPRVAGVDAVVPVVAGVEGLFGPRSIRVATAVLVLPAASWVSFNIPLGSASTISGVLFPAAVVGGCAGMRLLTARTVLDIAVGVAALGIAVAAAWFLSAGVDTLSSAATVAALAPGAAITSGWLRGRHRAVRRPAPTAS